MEEPFCVSENSVLTFFVQKRGISQFSVGNCLSHSIDELLKGTLCASKNFGSRKFYAKEERGCNGFPWKICCLPVPKVSYGDPSEIQKFSGL